MDRQESMDLLRRAKEGSGDALEVLYSRFAGKLLALIRLRMGRKLRGQMESRDILQATLLKSFQNIGQFESCETSSLMGWLARIAENEMRDLGDHHRRQRRDAERNVALDDQPGEIPAGGRSALSQVIWGQEAERLEQALESLDQPQREIILLRKFEELSFKEIGEHLGKSEDACRMMLARAMTKLTLKMAERP
jgi:RNA polymerase sigma-70 factor (ECF subfamily)